MLKLEWPWLDFTSIGKLSASCVHVWHLSLDHPGLKSDELWKFLSVDERSRADKYHFQWLRNRYIVRRGLLRIILGGYLFVQPATLQINYTVHGKPYLVTPNLIRHLNFNMSYSEDCVLFAFTYATSIGVDVEKIRPIPEYPLIATRFFSSEEIRMLFSLEEKDRLPAFFSCWTRKEAILKARGSGLTLPLSLFTVSLTPDKPACILDMCDSVGTKSEWFLYPLTPRTSYTGALAVQFTGAPPEVLTIFVS